MVTQGPGLVKLTLKKRNKVGGLTFHNFKTYYKATVTKTAWLWHKDRHIDQGNKTDSPGINPCIYDKQIFFFTKIPRPLKGKSSSLQQMEQGQVNSYIQNNAFVYHI